MRQSRHHASPEAGLDEEDAELGPKNEGVIIAHYGAQADVVEKLQAGALARRCVFRANLDNPVVGDRVIWCDNSDGGVIVAILPRDTELCRPDKTKRLRPVAANIDRIMLVFASEPTPHANLIDRYLVAAEHQGIKPVLVLNKVDLLTADNSRAIDELLAPYRALDYPIVEVSAKHTTGVEPLCQQIADHTCIFVGQSGVGKSSLINRILPDAAAVIGDLSQARDKGRHTTTTTRLYFLPNGGRLIDSPGIREFGLWHLDPEDIAEGFIEFREHLGHCQFRNCQHQQQPGCALQKALTEGKIHPRRMESYYRIVQSLEDG